MRISSIARLSICVPTYNRAECLRQLLDSLVGQVTEEVEVVIADNASTDHTEEVVRKYQEKIPNIRFHRWEENLGAERNFLKVVECAQGEYCWLMGSDDALMPGAIARILGELNSNCDLYLCNAIWCDARLKAGTERRWLKSEAEGGFFNLSDREELIRYLNGSRSLVALFAYISVLVFKKQKWSGGSVSLAREIKGYPHVYMLLSQVNNGFRLKHVPEMLVLGRRYNDVWASVGALNRISLDIDGYQGIFRILFPNDLEIQRKLSEILAAEYGWSELAGYRVRARDRHEWDMIEEKLRQLAYPPSKKLFIRILRYSRIPMAVLRNLRRRMAGISAGNQ